MPTSLLTEDHHLHIRQIDIDIQIEPVMFYVLYNKHVADSPGFSQLLAIIMQLRQGVTTVPNGA